MTDEEMNVAYMALGRLIARQCPAGFASATMAMTMEGDRSLLRIHYAMPDGTAAQAAPGDDAAQDILESLRGIRHKMAERGDPPWRTCRVSLRAGGHFAIEVE
jgi:hypothetical protein